VTQNTSYKVSWTRGAGPGETRTFPDFDAAAEFYDGIIEDPRTTNATLIEVTEKEVRCHESERGLK
jgi:hypothetical protein